MKNTILSIGFLFVVAQALLAQDINWRAEEKHKNVLQAYFGADYSSYYALSYGRLVQIKRRPLAIGGELTVPFGSDIIDDWRLRTSVQTELFRHNLFVMTLKPALIVRRYASPMARIYNLGADITVLYGFQGTRWGLVALVNYDRSISAHLAHRMLKEDYPAIQDGWYNMRSGNFKVGLRAGYTGKSWSGFLVLGKHFGQNFRDNPTLPFFAELSLQKRF